MKNQSSFNVRYLRLHFDTPKIMGILNVTPDSFSDGGDFNSIDLAVQRIEEMINQGAHIIDVGGESTRPGSDPVSENDEISRVIPVLKKAVPMFPEIIFSIDTTKFEVAKQAFENGVHIVNDVSGLRKEPGFAELCSEYKAGYILMHSHGDPKTMQNNPSYENVVEEISYFFERKIAELEKSGVKSIMIDPGIGFGKTVKHNCEIIAQLPKFSKFGYPVMIGASRKSMIGQLLDNRPVEGRLAGTLAVHYHSLMKGAKILRVHDVQEASDSIQVFNSLES